MEHAILYKGHSTFVESTDCLRLVSAQNQLQNPAIFTGRLMFPKVQARCLSLLGDLAQTRFFVPPNMLARILREADPIITCGQNMLRFESFSACGSVYGRLDIDSDGYEANHVSHGTTNVDFGPEIRSMFHLMEQQSQLNLQVSPEGLVAAGDGQEIEEAKVKLPERWLKNLAEVQCIQQEMKLYCTLSKSQVIRFLQRLPTTNDRAYLWAGSQGLQLRSRGTNQPQAKGFHRLKAMKKVLNFAEKLEVFQHPKNQAVAFVFFLGSQRMTWVLSSEPSRGFSGEGQLLTQLNQQTQSKMHQLRSQLKWQDRLEPSDFQKIDEFDKSLALLAIQGFVGFDLHSQAFFHRELPFRPDPEKLQPRKKAADRILEKGQIQKMDEHTYEVKTSSSTQVIRKVGKQWKCTCPWFNKDEDRGPCKHILAAMRLET